MKTVILLIGLLFSTFSLQAQDYEDVMYKRKYEK